MALYRLKEPQAELIEPVVVAALDGWVDAGSAATGAASKLAGKGRLVAEFDGDQLFDFRAPSPARADPRHVIRSWAPPRRRPARPRRHPPRPGGLHLGPRHGGLAGGDRVCRLLRPDPPLRLGRVPGRRRRAVAGGRPAPRLRAPDGRSRRGGPRAPQAPRHGRLPPP